MVIFYEKYIIMYHLVRPFHSKSNSLSNTNGALESVILETHDFQSVTIYFTHGKQGVILVMGISLFHTKKWMNKKNRIIERKNILSLARPYPFYYLINLFTIVIMVYNQWSLINAPHLGKYYLKLTTIYVAYCAHTR